MNMDAHKLIIKQLKQDLIGKDAFRGVTLSYAWLANQFGHFALSFIFTAIVYTFFEDRNSSERIVYWIYLPSLSVWVFWFVFELVNYVVSIIKLKKSSVIEKNAKSYFYRPRRWHFLDDLFTDLLFFAQGAFAASLLYKTNTETFWICIAISIVLLYKSIKWYSFKIYLQRALYPFQFRLSQWTEYISVTNKDEINRFMHSSFCGTQLLVLGEDDNEKIHISVGIGSEVSYQNKKCRYLTAMKAFECFYRTEPEDSPISEKFSWNWQEAELLIIDDINPSHSNINEVITPDEFLQKINDLHGDRNRKCLREKKVIWMLGNENAGYAEQIVWQQMLVKIGVDPTNIIIINLSEKAGTQKV